MSTPDDSDEGTPAGTDAGTPDTGSMATSAAGMDVEELGAVGECFEENTDASMIEDLRAGDTTSAESVYETCLADVLPASVVNDLEPVIEQAAVCGETASANVTDEEIAALEAGDREVAERLSMETLSCLSDELGIPLS